MADKPTFQRPTPLHKRIQEKRGDVLANAWAAAPVIQAAPEPAEEGIFQAEGFDSVLDTVLERTPRHLMPVNDRKREDREERQAQQQKPDSPTAEAATELLKEQRAAERKAFLDQMAPEEREEWFHELVERSSEDSRVEVPSLEDETEGEFDFSQFEAQVEAEAQNTDDWTPEEVA